MIKIHFTPMIKDIIFENMVHLYNQTRCTCTAPRTVYMWPDSANRGACAMCKECYGHLQPNEMLEVSYDMKMQIYEWCKTFMEEEDFDKLKEYLFEIYPEERRAYRIAK